VEKCRGNNAGHVAGNLCTAALKVNRKKGRVREGGALRDQVQRTREIVATLTSAKPDEENAE
jgi:hypothetical protein